jgi:hypothetical protein
VRKVDDRVSSEILSELILLRTILLRLRFLEPQLSQGKCLVHSQGKIFYQHESKNTRI